MRWQDPSNFPQEASRTSNKPLKLRNTFQELSIAGAHDSFHRLSAFRQIEQLSLNRAKQPMNFYAMEEVMKAITKLAVATAFAATAFAGVASAEGTIYTRSTDAAKADLVRDWTFNGGGVAGQVRQRAKSEMQADLVRDWNPKAAGVEEKGTLHTRSTQQAYDDLVRNWN